MQNAWDEKLFSMEISGEKSIDVSWESGQAVFRCMEYAYSITLVQRATDSDK